MTTDQPRADAIAALDDLVERWHAWNATDDPDLKVMLGLGLMQDAFDALPNLAALAPADPTADLRADFDVRPEVVQWFHDSEEICEHDYDPPPCAVMADALLESFTVAPRLYENKDGTFRFQRDHFGRLHRAALDASTTEDGS